MTAAPDNPKPPFVVGELGRDGHWRVLLMVPHDDIMIGCALDADAASSLARQLDEYAGLVRDKHGLPRHTSAPAASGQGAP